MTRLSVRRLGLVAWLCCVLAASGTARAAPRTDVVILANGDHITCEIRGLDFGELEVKTDDAGTIDIKWDRVARIWSTRLFEVETIGGRRLIGSLGEQPPGHVEVIGVDSTVVLALPSIVIIRVLGQGWLRGLDGSFDVGFTYTRGSGVAQLTGEFSVSRKRPSYETALAMSGVFTRQPDQEDSSRLNLTYRYWRAQGERWLIGALGTADRNTDLGIEIRGAVGGAVGYRFVKTNRQALVASAGVMVNREVPIEGETTTNVEGLVGTTYSLFIRRYPTTSVDIASQLVPSFSDPGRFRYQLDVGVKREIWRDFTVGVSLYDNYDNRPPSDDTLSNDVGMTLTLGWVF